MKEPSLNGMLDFLRDLGCELESLSNDNGQTISENNKSIIEILEDNGRKISSEIEQLLYYCNQNRSETVENAFNQLKDKDKKVIFRALVYLYPLTQNIIIRMIKKADNKPIDFLELYDQNKEMLKIIEGNISIVKDNSNYTNVGVSDYSKKLNKLLKDIEDLENNRDKLEKSIEGYSEKHKLYNNLQNEIKKLEQIKELGLDNEIEQLKMQKKHLINIKNSKDKEKDKLINEIELLKNELDSIKDNKSKEYQNTVKALEKCFKELIK